MIQIHVVNRDNRRLYEYLFDDYFRLRYEIYVNERGWRALERPDSRDIDQFDTDAATYLFALEGTHLVGGLRIVPTTQPTLMSDVFPQLTLRGPIRRRDVAELTRIFVIKERRGEQAQPRVEHLILCAAMEYGLAQRIAQFTIVMEAWWIRRLQEQCWRITPLGLPVEIDGAPTVGVTADVNYETVAGLRARRGIEGSILVWRGIEVSALPAA
jgi:acyl-homoserine lactone synthase